MLSHSLLCLINKSIGFAQLFREHCTFHKNLYFVKDLSKLGRDLKDVVIVDNSPSAYMFQPENAIPISSWYQDASDRELFKTIAFLTKLAKVDDVRHYCSRPKLSALGSVPSSPLKKEYLLQDDQSLKISASSKILIKKKNKNIFKTTKSSACDSLVDQVGDKGDSCSDNSSPEIKATPTEVKIDRLNTSRRKYRSSVKRTKVNQFFNNEAKNDESEQKTISKIWLDKRTSTSSRKKITTKDIHIWSESNFLSTLQTPKHSQLDELKLFAQMKYVNPASNCVTPISKAMKQKGLNKYASQPSMMKVHPKRKASRTTQLIPGDKKNIYLSKWYLINGKKVKV